MTLRLITGDGEDTTAIQHAIAAGTLSQVAQGNIRALAVVIVDADGNSGHLYYTGIDVAALHYAAATLQARLLSHGETDRFEGEWAPETMPEGMTDPFLHTGEDT